MKQNTMSKNFKKTFAKWFWLLFVVGIALILLVFWLITKGWLGYLPPLDELQNPKNKYATEVYSSDMQVLGSYYRTENRVGVQYADISPYMTEALVATEDVRFYKHSGIDGKALFRVFFKLGRAGGGSTLTQQLSKQLYSPKADNIFERALQKPIEWVIAAQLERLYSKEEIIMMYLNQFDFLYNAVGIKQAAQVYFNTTPADLKIEQAAMLVGMCKNPALYNPIRRPERALNRRNVVLSQMEKNDCITLAQRDSLMQLPLGISYHSVDHKQGLAPYFREYLRQVLTAKEPKESNYSQWNKQQYQLDKRQWDENPLYGFCNKNKKSDGTPYDLYNDGLRVYTTLDSRMQQYAEEAVSEHMQYLQGRFFNEKKRSKTAPFSRMLKEQEVNDIMARSVKQTERYRIMKKAGKTEAEIQEAFATPQEMRVFSYNGMIDTVLSPMDSIRWQKYFLRCGFMSMDPHSGHVKAYVGGPNFANFQYDMVNTGRRQVGSTVKPYIYTLAMDEGMWPCDTTSYVPVTLIDGNGNPWTPKESHKVPDDEVGKKVTLTWGLAQSSNWMSAYLMGMFTPEKLVQLMRSFGIEGQLDPVVSLCLGPCEVSVAEMVDAYTAFVGKGIRIEPLYVTRIEDNNGNVLATFTPQTHEIISEQTAYKMIYMLRNVVDHGTGVRTRFRYKLTMPMGGKTGTSQNNSDGWFMGFTPSLVSGCWVGGEDRAIHFDSMADGQGANTALPIFALYMQKVLADPTLGYTADEQFDIPDWFDPNAGCR
ncbi:MAG: transglycosylase domain-containing protein [Paludibacteraceae bacterium]|nr:transglycosylase domain-containing protein [Paludibacteraceae bacterium]MBQ9705634.1 transglycosylase domain-containing protein [Paludibacteraceae bacterium]